MLSTALEAKTRQRVNLDFREETRKVEESE